MNARVAMIVPVRDGARYLGAALESLAGQTRPPDEIVVVDDRSVDGSAALARSVPGVRVMPAEGEGPGAARNTGVGATTSELVGFLDADDLAARGRLALQATALEADAAAGAVAGRMENFLSPDRAEELAGRTGFPTGPVAAVMAGTMLVRREVFGRVGPFDPDLHGSEVVDWVARTREAGIRWIRVEDVVMRRRVHGANLSLSASAGYVSAARNAIARQRLGRAR